MKDIYNKRKTVYTIDKDKLYNILVNIFNEIFSSVNNIKEININIISERFFSGDFPLGGIDIKDIQNIKYYITFSSDLDCIYLEFDINKNLIPLKYKLEIDKKLLPSKVKIEYYKYITNTSKKEFYINLPIFQFTKNDLLEISIRT